MKLLRVKANHFKNCHNDITVDFIAKSKKTTEDKEYELQEIDDDLYVYSVGAFIGKNASGKTTMLELLDCCYDILGKFSLENKHFSYGGIELEIIFYHESWIYKYSTKLKDDSTLSNRADFIDQHIYRKKYYKTKVSSIYGDNDFAEMTNLGDLPEDTASTFFILKKKSVEAVFVDSEGPGSNTYQMVFRLLKKYHLSDETLLSIIHIFDSNIQNLDTIDEHNYRISINGVEYIYSDSELLHFLSSGTTKGMLLYIMAAASLQEGFDLLVDEVETHFHKSLVDNMISLYMDKKVNRHGASLIFSTHYCEVLDLFNRQDNIWICQTGEKITVKNMYEFYNVRSGVLKSKRFYNNAFQTAVNYNELMNLKRILMNETSGYV